MAEAYRGGPDSAPHPPPRPLCGRRPAAPQVQHADRSRHPTGNPAATRVKPLGGGEGWQKSHCCLSSDRAGGKDRVAGVPAPHATWSGQFLLGKKGIPIQAHPMQIHKKKCCKNWSAFGKKKNRPTLGEKLLLASLDLRLFTQSIKNNVLFDCLLSTPVALRSKGGLWGAVLNRSKKMDPWMWSES